jgi:hypothetical protein
MERDQYSISSLIIEKFTEKNKSSVRVCMGKRENCFSFYFKKKQNKGRTFLGGT